ncbi:MAG: energy transducer TonB [Elusimicrobia bacterium]|nr:energy transducer TonB [Elusimicrobiota bacterium]
MLENKITGISFFLSLTAHLLFLSLPAINSLTSYKLSPMKIEVKTEKYASLPKINHTGDEKKIKEVTEESKQIEPLHKLQPEEVVMEAPLKELIEEKVEAIDPNQEAMLRFQDIVKQKIEEKKEYPAEARGQGIEGIVYLRFTILSDGQTDKIKIIKSSGYKILDQSAVNTVRKANLFPPLPEELNIPCVQIQVNLVYTLK